MLPLALFLFVREPSGWWAVILAGLAALTGLYVVFSPLVQKRLKRRALRDPLNAHLNVVLPPEVRTYGATFEAKVTLTAKTLITVEHIKCQFLEGEGQTDILSLYDYQRVPPSTPTDVATAQMQDGSYYWEYHPHIVRGKGKRITLCVAGHSIEGYTGQLKLEVTVEEDPHGHVPLLLPISVPASQVGKDSSAP